MRQLWRGISQRLQGKKGQKQEIWVRNNYINGNAKRAGSGNSLTNISKNLILAIHTNFQKRNNQYYYAESAYLSVALDHKIIVRLQGYLSSWNYWLFDFSPNKINNSKEGNKSWSSKDGRKGRLKAEQPQASKFPVKGIALDGRREIWKFYNKFYINRIIKQQKLKDIHLDPNSCLTKRIWQETNILGISIFHERSIDDEKDRFKPVMKTHHNTIPNCTNARPPSNSETAFGYSGLIDTLLSNDMNIVSRESEVVSDITVGRGILECYKIGK